MDELIRSFPSVIRSIADDDRAIWPVVLAAWSRSIDGPLADHVVPIRLEGSRVIAAVSSRTWQRQLADLGPALVEKLNAAIGTNIVGFVEFRVDGQAVERHRAKGQSTESDSDVKLIQSEVVWPELEAAAEAILDEQLRERFMAAAAGTTARRNRMGI